MPVEWQLRHGERRGIPPIHVFHVAVGVEEVVALPMRRAARASRVASNSAAISSPLPKMAKRSSMPLTSAVTSPKRV